MAAGAAGERESDPAGGGFSGATPGFREVSFGRQKRMSATTAAPSAPTAAPPPPRPVRGAGAPPPDPTKMSYAEYKAHRGY